MRLWGGPRLTGKVGNARLVLVAVVVVGRSPVFFYWVCGGKIIMKKLRSYPLVRDKCKKPSLVLPEALMAYVRDRRGRGSEAEGENFPARAILCFSAGVSDSLRAREDFCETAPFYRSGLHIDIYNCQEKKKNVAPTVVSIGDRGRVAIPPSRRAVVSRFGIGAPASVVCLEKLRALGVREIISVGVVGSLNPDLRTGTKVLLQKAFRDEGCSYHYREPSFCAETPACAFRARLIRELRLRPVVTWTTDAPFRETGEEVMYFRSLGAECVEMEAGALITVGAYYGISVFCLGVVSDHLSVEGGWRPDFFDPSVSKSLREVLNQLLLV